MYAFIVLQSHKACQKFHIYQISNQEILKEALTRISLMKSDDSSISLGQRSYYEIHISSCVSSYNSLLRGPRRASAACSTPI